MIRKIEHRKELHALLVQMSHALSYSLYVHYFIVILQQQQEDESEQAMSVCARQRTEMVPPSCSLEWSEPPSANSNTIQRLGAGVMPRNTMTLGWCFMVAIVAATHTHRYSECNAVVRRHVLTFVLKCFQFTFKHSATRVLEQQLFDADGAFVAQRAFVHHTKRSAHHNVSVKCTHTHTHIYIYIYIYILQWSHTHVPSSNLLVETQLVNLYFKRGEFLRQRLHWRVTKIWTITETIAVVWWRRSI